MRGIPARLPDPGGLLKRLLENFFAPDRRLDLLRHELRTPLTGILGMATLLRESGLEGERLRFLLALEQSGAQLVSLLEERETARTRQDKRTAAAGELIFNGLRLLENITRAHWVTARQRGLELFLVFDHRLPVFWATDPVLLRQVLDNLISNAIKFTPGGHVLVEARRSRDVATGHGLELRVSDTGPGIPRHDASAIYALGERGRGAHVAATRGSGYGLYVSQRIAARLRGTLTHFGIRSGGTRFTLRLPGVVPMGPVGSERVCPRLLDGLLCQVELPRPLDRVVAHTLRRMGVVVRFEKPDGGCEHYRQANARITGSPPRCESDGISWGLPDPVLHASLEPMMLRLALNRRMQVQ